MSANLVTNSSFVHFFYMKASKIGASFPTRYWQYWVKLAKFRMRILIAQTLSDKILWTGIELTTWPTIKSSGCAVAMKRSVALDGTGEMHVRFIVAI